MLQVANGPANGFCDNEGVVLNVLNSTSTLNKKHNAVAYHKVREAHAAGVIQVRKKPGKTNLSDILTKCLPGPALKECCNYIFF